jgi:hypothetical protein
MSSFAFSCDGGGVADSQVVGGRIGEFGGELSGELGRELRGEESCEAVSQYMLVQEPVGMCWPGKGTGGLDIVFGVIVSDLMRRKSGSVRGVTS